MNEIVNDQETIRRYLLGDLAEAERAALEDAFLADGEVFERIEDAENDLVDDYVAARLGSPERKLFESHYLALPENRAKVESATVLRRELLNEKTEAVNAAVTETRAEKSTGFWQSIQNFFASGALVPAAGFAVLLFIVGGLWFAYRSGPSREIVYFPTPAPTISPAQPTPTLAPEANNNAPVNANQISPTVTPTLQRNANVAPRETPRANEPKENVPPSPPRQAPPPSARSTVSLALVTGLVRGEGEANKLVLPKNANQVRLTFGLPAVAAKYKEIEARIETVSGDRIWSGKIGPKGGRAALNLPAGLFGDEDYLLIVSGADEAGKRADFSQFYFNSERK